VIHMQLLNDALVTIVFVAAAVLTHRHERARGIRQIERLLAAVADQRNSPATK